MTPVEQWSCTLLQIVTIILEGAFISNAGKSTFSQVDLFLERVPKGLLHNNSQMANYLPTCEPIEW